jgi:hypothetical protein
MLHAVTRCARRNGVIPPRANPYINDIAPAEQLSRAAARMTDETLLSCRMIGPKSVAMFRAEYGSGGVAMRATEV